MLSLVTFPLISKKLITAALTAALAFSVPSVATAQSSFPAFSSSSETKPVSKTQQVEDKFAAALTAQGHTRHAQHDQAAEKAVQAAVDGNVTFQRDRDVPDLAVGQTFTDGYINTYLRFPVEYTELVLLSMEQNSNEMLPGYSVPFGVAVDESQSLVYLAFVIPFSAVL